MNEKQEEQMIKAAHKYWADESGSYEKEEIMVDAFVEGYKQAFALYNVVLQSEQLKCLCCDGTGIVEGESYDDKQSCLTCSGRGHFN